MATPLTELYEFIGQTIKKLRQEYPKGILSQDALAQHIGVGANTLSRWETGVYKPTPDDLDKLARFFKVPITVFFPDLKVDDRVMMLASATGGLDANDFEELVRYAEFRKTRRAMEGAKRRRAKR
jgi:transcriptional regulator with XRE-family HTH domain